MKKTLLDQVMSLGYDSKTAKTLIMSGNVLVNNEPQIIASIKIRPEDSILLKKSRQWVSRGAFKLLAAIKVFKINFNSKIVLDIGASAGGFTEVALKHGALKVYALDVGTNQLDYKLRTNNKVKVMEKTNLKVLQPQMFAEKLDIVVTDVSFISLKRVFDVLEPILEPQKTIIALIKPQFEASSNVVQKGGFVDKKYHKDIINNIISYGATKGFRCLGLEESPILGQKSKNTEYLSLFIKE